jgi:hypothetical protein
MKVFCKTVMRAKFYNPLSLTSDEMFDDFVVMPSQVDLSSSIIERVCAITCSRLLFLFALGISIAVSKDINLNKTSDTFLL